MIHSYCDAAEPFNSSVKRLFYYGSEIRFSLLSASLE